MLVLGDTLLVNTYGHGLGYDIKQHHCVSWIALQMLGEPHAVEVQFHVNHQNHMVPPSTLYGFIWIHMDSIWIPCGIIWIPGCTVHVFTCCPTTFAGWIVPKVAKKLCGNAQVSG